MTVRFLDRIENIDPKFHAFTTVTDESARAAARAADSRAIPPCLCAAVGTSRGGPWVCNGSLGTSRRRHFCARATRSNEASTSRSINPWCNDRVGRENRSVRPDLHLSKASGISALVPGWRVKTGFGVGSDLLENDAIVRTECQPHRLSR